MNPYFRDIFVTTLTCAGVAGSLRGDVDLWGGVSHGPGDPDEQGEGDVQVAVRKDTGSVYLN